MKTNFQLILLGVFIFATIIGVLIFAGILPGFRAPTGGVGGEVMLWGPFSEQDFEEAFKNFRTAHKADFTLTYVSKDSRTLEAELVDAIATGKGPDLVLLPYATAISQANKIAPIPYQSFPLLNYDQTFVPERNLYYGPDGYLALPIVVDPLVMYFNQDLLASGRLAQPPRTWVDLQTAVKNLTIADAQSNVTQSAIALGLFSNINNAKDILSLLILQAGNPIVQANESGLDVVLGDTMGYVKAPAEEALAFFNRFADPTNALYSWNSSWPEARSAFTRSNLVLYLGLASEYALIRKQNPQLNFGVALVPQLNDRLAQTFGRLIGVSVLSSTKNYSTALSVVGLLTSVEGSQPLAKLFGLPSARADLLQDIPKDSVATLFNQAAIVSRGWADPNALATGAIFKKMVEAVQVRGLTTAEAVKQAEAELANLIRNKK